MEMVPVIIPSMAAPFWTVLLKGPIQQGPGGTQHPTPGSFGLGSSIQGGGLTVLVRCPKSPMVDGDSRSSGGCLRHD